jgi:hypothetical protein
VRATGKTLGLSKRESGPSLDLLRCFGWGPARASGRSYGALGGASRASARAIGSRQPQTVSPGSDDMAHVFGDTPPTVVAIEEDLVRRHAESMARCVQRAMMKHPTWIVGQNLEPLRRALDGLGIHLPQMRVLPGDDLPRYGGALVPGDMMAAFDVAEALGSKDVQIWMGDDHADQGPAMPVRVRAHDEMVRLTVMAPMAAEAAAR